MSCHFRFTHSLSLIWNILYSHWIGIGRMCVWGGWGRDFFPLKFLCCVIVNTHVRFICLVSVNVLLPMAKCTHTNGLTFGRRSFIWMALCALVGWLADCLSVCLARYLFLYFLLHASTSSPSPRFVCLHFYWWLQSVYGNFLVRLHVCICLLTFYHHFLEAIPPNSIRCEGFCFGSFFFFSSNSPTLKGWLFLFPSFFGWVFAGL